MLIEESPRQQEGLAQFGSLRSSRSERLPVANSSWHFRALRKEDASTNPSPFSRLSHPGASKEREERKTKTRSVGEVEDSGKERKKKEKGIEVVDEPRRNLLSPHNPSSPLSFSMFLFPFPLTCMQNAYTDLSKTINRKIEKPLQKNSPRRSFVKTSSSPL